jgi:hypothetical protein
VLTREEILAKAVDQEVVNLPSGGQVKVRGLTRDEALNVQEAEGTAARDNLTISQGLVEPALTVEDVAAWAATAPAADSIEISRAIARLSGMSEGAGKSGPDRARRKR